MSDRKEQTPLCFLVMFFSLLNVLYQAVFMGSVSGENHRDNPPFFPPLLAMVSTTTVFYLLFSPMCPTDSCLFQPNIPAAPRSTSASKSTLIFQTLAPS